MRATRPISQLGKFLVILTYMFTADQGLAHVIEHGHYVLMLQYIAGLMGNRLAVVMNTNWCN